MMTTSQLVTGFGTLVASFIGAWLAAKFALSRFYREKVWERKTAAYTAIFDALHDMGRWFGEHLEAEERGIELKDETKSELSRDFKSAKRALERRLASETWLIPDNCRQRLAKMMGELDQRGDDWIDLLETGMAAISDAEAELRKLVRQDLGLDRAFLEIPKRWFSRIFSRGRR